MSNGTEDSERFGVTLRCKAPTILRKRLERIAKARTKRVPELYREAMVVFVDAQEKALNLPPIEEVAA